MPEEVAVKALADGEPFSGAAFNVRIPTTKNALPLLCLDRSDVRGEVRLSGVDLERLVSEAKSLGIMDYGTLVGELHVSVVNRDDIASRRRGYETWGARYFPDDYLAWLDAVEATLEEVPDGTELRTVVGVRGGTMSAFGSLRYA
jgi:hypothetical protein